MPAPQAGIFSHFLGGEKRFENLVQRLLVHAASVHVIEIMDHAAAQATRLFHLPGPDKPGLEFLALLLSPFL